MLSPTNILQLSLVCHQFIYFAYHDQLWIQKRRQYFPRHIFDDSVREIDRFKYIYLKEYRYIPVLMRKLFTFVVEGDFENLKQHLTVDDLKYSVNLLNIILKMQDKQIFDHIYVMLKEHQRQHGNVTLNFMSARNVTHLSDRRGYFGVHEEVVPLLHLSVLLNQSPEIVRELAENNNDKDIKVFCYGTPLEIAAQFNHTQLMKILLVDSHAQINAAAYAATYHGSYEAAQLLYQHIITHQARDRVQTLLDEYLSTACQQGHEKIVKLLLRLGADINTVKFLRLTPLYISIQNEHIDVVRTLLECEADVTIGSGLNQSNTPPIGIAASKSLKLVKLLVDKRADINATNTKGTTPLYFAVQEQKVDIVRFLLEIGARVDIIRFQHKEKYSVMTMAAETGNTEIIYLLIKGGANVNHVCGNGMTALHYAVKHDHVSAAQLFLENGADINALAANKLPLHFANKENDAMICLLKSWHNSGCFIQRNPSSNLANLSLLSNRKEKQASTQQKYFRP